MRILYLHYLQSSDTAMSHVRSFAAAARECGHEVVEQPLNPHFESDDSGDGGSRRERLKDALRYWLHEPKELLWNARYFLRERAQIASCQPDVLLVRDHNLTASALVSSRSAGVPLVLEMNAPALENKLFLRQYWHVPFAVGVLERLKVKRANRCLVVSGALRDHLVERHRASPERFRVVPNGADPERFSRSAGERETAQEDGVVVGFVGSFQPWHGTELLAQMIVEIGTRHPDVRFLLVGDGPDRDRVNDYVAKLGDRVEFTGSVAHDEVPDLVRRFDIGVVADAGFYMSPLKVFEWMSAEVAVVAPGLGPLHEVIDHEQQGLLFEAGSRDALVEAVDRLVMDGELRKRLGRSARQRILESLTWRHNAERVLDACLEAVDETRRG